MKLLLPTIFLLLFSMLNCVGQQEEPATEKPSSSISGELFPNFTSTSEMDRHPLLVSTDFGKSWKKIGQGFPEDTQVSFIEKMGNEMVMATDNQGVFLSEGNKTNWQFIGEGLPGKKINALFVEEGRILVGVYQKGIYESTDRGAHWEALNYDLPNLVAQSIFMEEEIIAGTDIGIFKLNREQQHWVALYNGVQVLSLDKQAGKLIAGTNQGTLLSENEGKDWTWIHEEGAVHYTHLVGDKVVEMYIYGDVFLSSDWGTHWTKAAYGPRAGSYVYEVVEAGDYLLMSNNYGIHRSADGGQNWQLVFATEKMGFFDFMVEGDIVYSGTRTWDEYRAR